MDYSFESQSIISAFNPQASGPPTQDPHLSSLGQTPMMSWLSNPLSGQQAANTQAGPYGSSSSQYLLNNNQDTYLQPLPGFSQSQAAHGPFQTPFWSALAPTIMFPSSLPQTILNQAQTTLNHESQSPTTSHRPLTPTNSNDLLSTSQPNQSGAQFMNMPRAAQTSGTS